MKKTVTAVLAPALYLSCTPAQAESGPYQRVAGPQPGKCIFSTQLMPPDKYSDPAYSRVTANFSEGDRIHIRCFYAQPLREYAKLGSTGNTLRDKQTYYAHLIWKRKYENTPGKDAHNLATVWRSYTNPSLRRERFELMDSDTCSFEFKDFRAKKYGAFPSGCVNLGNNIRKFAGVSRPQLRVPEVAEVCVRVRLASANAWRTRQENNTYVREPDYKNKVIAEGCFNYKMNDSGGVAASSSGQPIGIPQEEPVNAPAQSSASDPGVPNPPTETSRPRKPRVKVPRIKLPSSPF